MSNKGLNSNEALEESTATNSSVTLSGIRREKEAMIALDIKDYTTDAGKRQKIEDPNSRHCISAASRSARPPPRGYPSHVAATPVINTRTNRSYQSTAGRTLPRCRRLNSHRAHSARPSART